MKRILLLLCVLLTAVSSVCAKCDGGAAFEAAFDRPSESTKPAVYWYWISDHVSKEGITKDLEAMAQVGIGEAYIGNIYELSIPLGAVKVLSDAWWDCVVHAICEAHRLNIRIGLFNSPGWSQSGGPWITPGQAMRFLNTTEQRVQGGKQVRVQLERPARHTIWQWNGMLPVEKQDDYFKPLRVQAFRVPAGDGEWLTTPQVRVRADRPGAEALFDGDLSTSMLVDAYPMTIDLHADKPFTARSLSLMPVEGPLGAAFELQVRRDDGTYRTVARRDVLRRRLTPDLGGLIFGAACESFEPVTAQDFRIILTGDVGGRIGELCLSGAGYLSHYVEKQLGKMFDSDKIRANTYVWSRSSEPGDDQCLVRKDEVIDLTDRVDSAGMLCWDAPEGEWIIQRTGLSLTNTRNAPATPEGTGLEVDKMNKEAVAAHFDAFVGEILRRVPKDKAGALRHVVADSYEQGSENWTEGFGDEFRKAYGYDPEPWLPVLTGRIVESADRSDRFLWDLRRLVADQIPAKYVSGMREAAGKHGLRLWLENYGHWGFPGEALNYGGASDDLGGEFWLSDTGLGTTECRSASSAAHIYGKPIVSAEAFTSTWSFRLTPRDFKARGDWSWTEGINHFVFHVYIHQPDDRKPGINAWFGTDFNRNSNWFLPAKSYIDYVRRSTGVLQTGRDVADVAYFTGEDAPKQGGQMQPALPRGYNYDLINGEVLRKYASCRDGRLCLESGASYRVLVLPDQQTMRPEMLETIARLVRDGLVVLGPRPKVSPSNAAWPVADERLQKLAGRMWRGGKINTYGKGTVLSDMSLEEAMAFLNNRPDVILPDDVLYTHRRAGDADAYFLSYQGRQTCTKELAFRVEGRQPELWNPVTGEKRDLPEFTCKDGMTHISLRFAEADSWFVVFRKPAGKSVGGVNFPDFKTWTTLRAPWQVSFAAVYPGTPEPVTLHRLEDLSQSPNEDIRYYSGTIQYDATFALDALPEGEVWLDLGRVETMARITLNGHRYPFLWRYPYRVEVSELLQKSGNRLRVEVVDTWWNRLLGDCQPGATAHLSVTHVSWSADNELHASGLLGPVTLGQ